ncbi:anhydro-N-acetylmuramic acid kinase [Roseateles koreensis]|uniref:Anhydro-N-acetylmuramic acid kinase n=1 Tax=Roseateles koreensis TaxID=2987526 RepID=A0ABT5KRC7_9BURK|nr:anhydro-N-acetylmuramic acid kinase [Roseateles koreensis]MDC8785449.1 anhydro-N-acetylmuramic acid kinase [Roseateles koreensis]
MPEFYIGLMSGTSLDGVDAVLASFDGTQPSMAVRAHLHHAYPPALRDELLALNSPGSNELHRAALAANAVARSYADLVAQLLEHSGLKTREITALGAHGQTVRHQPSAFDGCGYTTQLLNGALLAEQTGIDVICDFRNRDLAAGGQGAPLVPAFHRTLFGRSDADVAVLNIGGISNISILGREGWTLGFDCGPGNCLMDAWTARHLGQAYDDQGTWAATGQVLPTLLKAWLAEPFFAAAPPKSSGRDLFNTAWVKRYLSGAEAPEDVQRTLLALTVRSIVDSLHLGLHLGEKIEPHSSLRAKGSKASELLVCGGGALNTLLMQQLQTLLPETQVRPTDAHGLPAMQVEGAAFAWLAMRFMKRSPGNLAQVTGAAGPRVLGALYPA